MCVKVHSSPNTFSKLEHFFFHPKFEHKFQLRTSNKKRRYNWCYRMFGHIFISVYFHSRDLKGHIPSLWRGFRGFTFGFSKRCVKWMGVGVLFEIIPGFKQYRNSKMQTTLSLHLFAVSMSIGWFRCYTTHVFLNPPKKSCWLGTIYISYHYKRVENRVIFGLHIVCNQDTNTWR